MTDFDYERPYVDEKSLPLYKAMNSTSLRYGKVVRATELSNIQYLTRFNRFKETHNMMPPPSCGRIFMGYLVVRKLGTPDQYETWMSEDVFDDLYAPKDDGQSAAKGDIDQRR